MACLNTMVRHPEKVHKRGEKGSADRVVSMEVNVSSDLLQKNRKVPSSAIEEVIGGKNTCERTETLTWFLVLCLCSVMINPFFFSFFNFWEKK